MIFKTVQSSGYEALTNEKQMANEKLISEKTISEILPFDPINLQFPNLAEEVEVLVTRKISESDKIEQLVKDAVLNRWVNEGCKLHAEKYENCAFCGNTIKEDRWKILEKHFDEETEELEKDIDSLVIKIESEKKTTSSALAINKDIFYSSFHKQLDEISEELKRASGKYTKNIDSLLNQLKARKDDIINTKIFDLPSDCSSDLVTIFSSCEKIRIEANEYTGSLGTEQSKAREALRLNEVSEFITTIKYDDQLISISELLGKLDEANKSKDKLDSQVTDKETLIKFKKRQLNDEEKGAIKVNEYLNDFFGNTFLTLEAIAQEDDDSDSKQIKLEIIRDGKKAYHLSEGECSLLAFCYFLAKLDDIDTKGTKPIIWVDDPVSSFDGNHIFFAYSLLSSEIVSKSNFEQIFISTHNLEFLKYLKRLNGKFGNQNSDLKEYGKAYFIINRHDKVSTINLMPKHLKKYVTEFNYLFHQIYKCASIETVDDSNYTTFYNFGNNARKFLELYLYYKYPDAAPEGEKLQRFFGGEKIPAVLTDRINNEYSHLCAVFERGSTPVEVPEMKTTAQLILEKLKSDSDQYKALLKSIGVTQQSSTAEEGS